MYEKVKAYVEKYRMLTAEDKVIAGISGGADSVCLLFVLLRLKEEIGFGIHAVHVNHGIRGEAADRDEGFVRRLCQEKETPLTVFREDVALYARDYKMTEEEAGRKVRRESFEKTLGDVGGTKIALAHHMNDNAETVLWNLCRGTGIRGLGGIAPSSGVWIRPFLCVKREEIESYLEKWGISYCTDESNLSDDYTRNRVRAHVLPYLEDQVNSQTVRHMSETMEQMRLVGEFVDQEVSRYEERCVRYGGGKAVLMEAEFRQVPDALRRFVLQEMLCRIAGRRKDIGSVHITALEELGKRQVGRQVDLPYGMRARRCYEGIEVFIRKPNGEGCLEFELSAEKGLISCKEMTEGAVCECPAEARVFERTADMVIFPENPYTKWFDYDIIENTVKIRHRRPGDYITISKEGGTQKLKQYFINEKIPGGLRDRIWLAADGQHIMWVAGYRQNQKYQITDKTRRILELKFYGGQDDGRERQSDDFRSRGCEKD